MGIIGFFERSVVEADAAIASAQALLPVCCWCRSFKGRPGAATVTGNIKRFRPGATGEIRQVTALQPVVRFF